jgi:hypothetical protein
MRKNLIIKIVSIIGVLILIAGATIYFFRQENEVKTVTDEGTSGVIINEVMTSNSGFLPDEQGEFPDWIELYNPTNGDINLYGFGLSDDETTPIKFALPDITIKSKGYLIVFASGKGISALDQPFAHTNFRLNSKGDIIILSNRAGQVLDRIDLEPIPTNISIGRLVGDAETLERFENPTPGFENTDKGLIDYKASKQVTNPELIITEVMTSNRTMYKDNIGDYSDWIEVYNVSDSEIDLSGYYLSDNEADPLSFRMPDVKLKSGEYFVFFASGDMAKTDKTQNSTAHTDFKLSSYEETLVISNLRGQTLDTLYIKELPSDYSYAKVLAQDGKYSDEWETTLNPSPGYLNTAEGYNEFREANPVLLGDIIINEVVFSNDSFAVESNGEYYDWIEIHNRGNKAVNLEGYGLTNNTANPGKWRFPDMEIRAGEFIIIQASGVGETSKSPSELKKKYLNTNYTLSLAGEIIALFDKEDNLLDRYNIDVLEANISMGRQGGDNILVFPTPTPGVLNIGGVVGYTQNPKFSVEAGVYGEPKLIEIDVPKRATCFYTLDGSIPTTKSEVYQQGILVEKTTTIRAIAHEEKYMVSPIITDTYFIDVNHTLDILTITTDPKYLWDEKQGIYALGSGVDINDERLKGTTFIDMGDGIKVFEYNTANDNNDETLNDRDRARAAIQTANFKKTDFEVPANFALYVNGKQAFSQDIGLQLFGSYSRDEVQKSFAIYARGKYGSTLMEYPFFETRDYTEYKTVVARQSGQDCKFSRVRDIFMTSLMEKSSDIDVQAYRQCVLYLNGKYWGIYNLREKSNKYFAASRYYAPNPDDNIDFLKGNGDVLAGSNKEYKALEKFMDDNDIGIAENYEYVKSKMDVNNYMDWLIAEVYFVNTDDGNRKFYRVKSDDGLWRWILYDLDWAMWGDRYKWNYIEEVIRERGTGAGGTFSTSIARGLFENDEWKREFLERYAYHLKNTFAVEVSMPVLSELKENIKSEINNEAATFKWNPAAFEREMQVLETFLINRPAYAKKYLQETLEISEQEMKEIFGE